MVVPLLAEVTENSWTGLFGFGKIEPAADLLVSFCDQDAFRGVRNAAGDQRGFLGVLLGEDLDPHAAFFRFHGTGKLCRLKPGQNRAVRDQERTGGQYAVRSLLSVVFYKNTAIVSLKIFSFQKIPGGEQGLFSWINFLRIYPVGKHFSLKVRSLGGSAKGDHAGGEAMAFYVLDFVDFYMDD